MNRKILTGDLWTRSWVNICVYTKNCVAKRLKSSHEISIWTPRTDEARWICLCPGSYSSCSRQLLIYSIAYICKSNDFSPAAQHYKFHGWRVVFLLWGKLVTRWVLQPVQHQRRLLCAPFFPHHSPWPHRRSLHGFALNTSHVLVSY